MAYEFFEERRIVYGEEGATFVRRCEKCFRFVKADEKITFRGNGELVGDNATCSKCGRTKMIFEGFI